MSPDIFILITISFIAGICLGRFTGWADRRELEDKLLNAEDERDKWAIRYALLRSQLGLADADWWKHSEDKNIWQP